MSDPLQPQLQDSIDEYNYWTAQYLVDKQTTQDALNAALNSSDPFMAMMLVIMNVLPDCMNEVGDLMGMIAGQLDIMSSISSYVSSMESFFAESNELTKDQANTYLAEMQDLYHILGGTGNVQQDQTNPNPCDFLSVNDQTELLGYLDNLATAYGNEYDTNKGITPPEGGFTPYDINNGMLVTAQTAWYNQAHQGTGDNPNGGSEDANYNSANMAFQQMNTKITAVNQGLNTQQSVWSSTFNNYQATDEDGQKYINTVDANSVNNENASR